MTLEFSLKYGNNLGNFLTHWEERKGTHEHQRAGRARMPSPSPPCTRPRGWPTAWSSCRLPTGALEPTRDTAALGPPAGQPTSPCPSMPDVAVVRLNKTLSHTP
ncbi:MAG: hypothetical protein WKG07_04785 [Hymenobacter sp.]